MLGFRTVSILSRARERECTTLGLWLAGYNDPVSKVWMQVIVKRPVIITPHAAFNLFTPKGTLELVEQPLRNAQNIGLASGCGQGRGKDRP